MMKRIPLIFTLFLAILVSIHVSAQETDEATSQDEGRPWLGVSLQSTKSITVTDGKKEVKREEGARVKSVAEDSPAEAAGLEKGDIIVELNDEDIASADELVDALQEMKPGDHATMKILREGREETVSAILDKRKTRLSDSHFKMKHVPNITMKYKKGMDKYADAMKNFDNVRVSMFTKPVLGVKVQTLEKQLGEYFKAPNGKGVLVTEVMDMDDSPAKQAGMQAGDVIVRINEESVEDRHDISSALDGLEKGDPVTIEVIRNGARKSLAATINEDVQSYAPGSRDPFILGDLYDDDDTDVRIQMLPQDMHIRINGEDVDFDMDNLDESMKEMRIELERILEDAGIDREEIQELKNHLRMEKKSMEDAREETQHKIRKRVYMKKI